MAVIAMPASVRIRRIVWNEESPAQINRSQWTGRDQVIADPWHSRRSAEVELAPIIGESNILAWRLFLALLKGRVNTFRLIAVEGAQAAAGNPVTAGGGAVAGATSVALAGLPASTTILAGRYLTISDQLLLLSSNLVVDGAGAGTATFSAHPLRAAVSNGVAVEVRYPTALVALASDVRGYSVEPGTLYGVSFSVEERF